MKKSLPFLILPFLLNSLLAQQFVRMNTDPLATTPSDSRSVNLIDVNGDGWEDVFISNGLNGGQTDLLYLNQGDGTFAFASGNPITEDSLSSVGATFADWDNDGDPDAYVTSWYGQPNYFYKNDGTGQLVKTLGIALPNSFSETASWADVDQNGWLDLYVTNSGGNRANYLILNQGNGSFTRIDTGAWTTELDYSRHAMWSDLDGDGKADLFVTNEESQSNDLFLNAGNGNLQAAMGNALTIPNRSSMGASSADIDNDGDLDVLVVNSGYFQPQANQLFMNDGNGSFTLVDTGALVTDLSCSYGSAFADYDNDGDEDVLVTNGYCGSELTNYLYENRGNGWFVRVEQVMTDLEPVCSYGAAWADLNQDGFLDVVIANCKNNSAASQPENDYFQNLGNTNHWLRVQLTGTLSNRDAIGAKIRVLAQINGQARWQLREISSQSGYSGQNSFIAHFGLGATTSIDSLRIEWPSGILTELGAQSADQLLTLEESNSNGVSSLLPEFSWSVSSAPGQASLGVRVCLDTRFAGKAAFLSCWDTTGRMIWSQNLGKIPADGRVVQTLSLPPLTAGVYHVRLQVGAYGSSKSWIQRN